jgi:hypothetical protein
MADFKEETINWLLGCSDHRERDDFLRRVFNALPDDGLKRCQSLISKNKKRRKELEANGWVEVLHQPTVSTSKKSEEEPKVESHTDGSVQSNLSVPSVLASTGWLAGFNREQVVGLDVQKV